MTFLSILLVAIGSSSGAVARYVIGQSVAKVNNSIFPWGTWIINIIGTLLLGIFTQLFSVLNHDINWLLLLGTGFCGGFTTFSTMSVEAIRLFRTKFLLGIVYLGSSLALGLTLAFMTQWWI